MHLKTRISPTKAKLCVAKSSINWKEWFFKQIFSLKREINFLISSTCSGALLVALYPHVRTEIFLAIAAFWLTWAVERAPNWKAGKIKIQQLKLELKLLVCQMRDRSQLERLKALESSLQEWLNAKNWHCNAKSDLPRELETIARLAPKYNLLVRKAIEVSPTYTAPLICASTESGKLGVVELKTARSSYKKRITNHLRKQGLVVISFDEGFAKYPHLCCWWVRRMLS